MYQYRSPMEFKTGVGSNLPNRKGFCEGQVVNLRIRIRLVSQKPIFANASCLIGDPDIKIGGRIGHALDNFKLLFDESPKMVGFL